MGDLTSFLLEPAQSLHGFQGEDTIARYFWDSISRSPKTGREPSCFEVGLQAAFLNVPTHVVFDHSIPFQLFKLNSRKNSWFGFFPTLPMALSLMPVATWQCLSWWRGGRVPREGGKMAHHFFCIKIPGSVFSTFPDTSISLSAALSQLYSLQWFSSLNKCRLFREHFF